MWGYHFIEFIDFTLDNKMLRDITNLLSPKKIKTIIFSEI